MKKLLLLALLLPISLLAQVAEKPIDMDAIHPRMRNRAYPQQDEIVNINPVALLWQPESGKNIRYNIRLSQDPSFPKKNTISKENIEWAMYNNHSTLKSGKWYWQYDIVRDGEDKVTSNIFPFVVKDDTHKLATPTIDELQKLVTSNKYPRLFVSKNQLADFQKRNKNSKDAKRIIKFADKNLNQPLIQEAPTRPRDTTGVTGWEKKVLMRFMYHKFGEIVRVPIENQALAHLLTGESKYAKEAVRQALHIAKMDPKGWATQEDFNSASVMLAMATAYDVGCNYMSEAEKSELRNAIQVRGDYFFKLYNNEFEAHGMDNHVWQHTLRRFFMTALAMSGEMPNADKWLAYTYEAWCSRFPILGGEDGGWHDGNSYYGVNFETFVMIPLMLKNLTNVDFFNLPWYKNAPDYLIYSFPKNSYSTGFGDGYEAMNKPSKKFISYADALARETNNGYARAYADNLVNDNKDKIADDADFQLYRLLSSKKSEDIVSKDLSTLPQAKLFRDGGFALMHTDVTNTDKNLMASFFSVPFGSTGHAHAAHNGFTISYGGKQLFGGSGYYSNFNDPHTLKHYRTRGHNTILADGMAQAIGENSYGWIARFANTPALSYALGDATRAYGYMKSDFWMDRMDKSEVDYTHANGFGNPEITRFRRHFTLLRPNIIVIYDELASTKDREWTWLLHSYQEMKKENDVLLGENEVANAKVYLYTNDELKTEISDKYFSPAINWKQRKSGDDVLVYDNHWHAENKTRNKHAKVRFVAIIKITEKGIESVEPVNKDGKISIEGWTIQAELDATKKARLEIYNDQGDAIYYNSEKQKSSIEGSTSVLNNNKLVDELIDIHPKHR